MTNELEKKFFLFRWYHREEFQILAILLSLIAFFARTYWVLVRLIFVVFLVIAVLYLLRILEGYLSKNKLFPKIVKKYRNLKESLHGRSIERSRIAMALLAAWVIGVLFFHRIKLAQNNIADRTPTDIYWILFLGIYGIVCTVTALYLLWLWNTWSYQMPKRIPFLDGLVASLFFYHGFERKDRLVTYIAAFFLGGLPSYFALRLSPEMEYGYEFAVGLTIPLLMLILGGGYYAMKKINKKNL